MSFILDALRKSESERQRLSQTAIAELPIGRRRRGQPWWVFALGALLLANIVVLTLVLLRNQSPPSTTATDNLTATPTNAARSVTPTAAAPSQSNDRAVAAHTLQEVAAPAQVQYETVPRSELEIANAAASLPEGGTLVRPIDAQRAESPTEANTTYATAPQDLRVDLHVYSNNPHERFVMINMRRYTEGQLLPNGATVEQIVMDGVVLYQNGSRYKLNRN